MIYYGISIGYRAFSVHKISQWGCIGHTPKSLHFFRKSDKILKDGFYAQEATANIQKFCKLLKLDEFVKLTWVSEFFWHIQQLKYIQIYSVCQLAYYVNIKNICMFIWWKR